MARDEPEIVPGVHDLRILRIGRDPSGLAAADGIPVGRADTHVADAAWNPDRRVVLLRSVDPIGEAVVGGDPVELRGRLIVLCGPGPAAVEADRRPAVVAHDHAVGIVGVDPQVVVVAVGYMHARKVLAPVGGLVHLDVGQVNDVRVLRIGVDPGVVPGALADLVLVVDVRPLLAAVVADVEAALLLRFQKRINAPRPRGRSGHADLPQKLVGKSFGVFFVGQLLPGIAAIGRLVEPASRAAAHDLPGMAHDLPETGVENPRIVRVHRQVRCSRLRVDEEDPFPALAAVRGPVDAAFFIGAVHMALRGDVDDIGIGGVNADAPDLPAVSEPDVLPARPAVGRLVDAVAVRDVAADRLLARAHVEDVRVRFRYRDRADRARLEVLVGNDLPVRAAVRRLPDAAARRAEVIDQRLMAHAGHRRDASAAVRADASEFEAREPV